MSKIVALSGGVGGAKLGLGLARVLAADELVLVANTGDDFEHLGLTICPDLDTLTYTLAGIANPEQGWGIAGESWDALAAIQRLGGPDWFLLGDQDIATHLLRRHWLSQGMTLSAVTAQLCQRLNVVHPIVPMSDHPVRTRVTCRDEGVLDFQHYFVRQRCQPVAVAIDFAGADSAVPSAGFVEALEQRDLDAVVICPSNPFLSIDPILALPGVRERLANRQSPVVAVSPIIGGQAVKGPTAKLMAELGLEVTNFAIAEHYAGLIDGLVIDPCDVHQRPALEQLGLEVLVIPTLMQCEADKIALATKVVEFASALGNRQQPLLRRWG